MSVQQQSTGEGMSQGTFFSLWNMAETKVEGGSNRAATAQEIPMPYEKGPKDKSYTYYAVGADQGRVFRKVLETVSALAAILLGIQFISSGYSPDADLYLPLQIVGPAYLWGIGMVVLAAVRLAILVVNGYWPHSHVARKYLSAAFIFLVWLPLATCFWWSFQLSFVSDEPRTYPGLAYSMFTLGSEFLIYYAHASFVYVVKRG